MKTKKVWNNIKMWYKILTGLVGIGLTTLWFGIMVTNTVSITVNGVVVAGPLVFGMILLGNGYGLYVLGRSGYDDLRNEAATKKQIHDMHESWKTTTKWNENDEL